MASAMPSSTGGRYHVRFGDASADVRGDGHRRGERRQHPAGGHRRAFDVDLDGVDEDRHIDHRDHERGTDHEVDDERGAHVAAAEDRALDQRVIRSALVPHERDAATTATGYSQRRSVPPDPVSSSRPDTLWISALPSSARLSETSVAVSNPAPIQSTRDPWVGRSCSASAHHTRDHAHDREWDVQPELPLPREEPDEHGPVQRSPHPAQRVDRAERPEGAGAAAFGVDIADHGERDRHHGAAAERRQHTADEERPEGRRERDEDRTGEEQRVGAEERPAPADHIAEPAGDRHDGDVRDQVRVDDPRRIVETVGQYESEVADDRSQHRRHDGQVVGGDEHTEADDRQHRTGRRLLAWSRVRNRRLRWVSHRSAAG